jgi:DNA-binding LacI/PurR family transcriptional regulator
MKRISMADIAKAAGLSKNAVSLALRNDSQIPEVTRLRIERIARIMGYERNYAIGSAMSMIRRKGITGSLGTIALINANDLKNAFTKHPTIPSYVKGCTERAAKLGYSLDHFWLHEMGINGERFKEVLESRGVIGAIFVGLMRKNRLPEFINPVIGALPCVATGVRIREPALNYSCVDHHMVTLSAFEKAVSLGYKRPGLVLDCQIDELVEHRFTAGYMIGQALVPVENRLKPFTDSLSSGEEPPSFRKWLEAEKPDVIFSLYNSTRRWVGNNGLKVPQDIGLIQLEWRASSPEWAGMNQHNDISGDVAVDMLITMIHNGEKGVPPFARATLISPTWVDGKTVRVI